MQVVSNSNSGTVAVGASVSVSVSCPAGSVMTGGGGQVTTSTANGRVGLRSSYPSGPNTWTAIGSSNQTSGTAQITVTAFALCET